MAIRQGATDNWTKSSYSGGNGACVEVKSPVMEAIAVRDSKVQDGPSLTFAPGSWTSFVADVTEGRLRGASPERHGVRPHRSSSLHHAQQLRYRNHLHHLHH